ncbi:hypothetical protein [Actinobacillus porcinus]|uniref:hypothetical protein n=1 Tax=Actinobacillus porcinus TaxID=51048 RepID=UPI0023580276|nr:hypothetical protein [Actinobacillus porcinus]MCI5763136.1 hypothetical protein [Actinobacillus porcinus]MDY5421197.1 hypothetical protein [Actinobacillus porcinus]
MKKDEKPKELESDVINVHQFFHGHVKEVNGIKVNNIYIEVKKVCLCVKGVYLSIKA